MIPDYILNANQDQVPNPPETEEGDWWAWYRRSRHTRVWTLIGVYSSELVAQGAVKTYLDTTRDPAQYSIRVLKVGVRP
jgi:hypothetical protein